MSKSKRSKSKTERSTVPDGTVERVPNGTDGTEKQEEKPVAAVIPLKKRMQLDELQSLKLRVILKQKDCFNRAIENVQLKLQITDMQLAGLKEELGIKEGAQVVEGAGGLIEVIQ